MHKLGFMRVENAVARKLLKGESVMVTRKNRCVHLSILLCSLIGVVPVTGYAEIVVIGNKNIAVDSVTVKQATKLWLAKLKKLPGTGKITVVDQVAANTATDEFYDKVVNKEPSELRAYWAKMSFTGKAFPPEKLINDAAVVKWVANTPGGLGYVESTAVNNSVKSLLTAK